jgi:hypothetical protein
MDRFRGMAELGVEKLLVVLGTSGAGMSFVNLENGWRQAGVAEGASRSCN